MEMRDNNCSSDSIYQKSNYVRGVSGASCAASLVGSVLIILSYMCFKRLRTKVREILVHLSVADSGVAAANLVGIVVYFDRFYDVQCDDEGKVYNIVPPQHRITILCNVQAFFALYFTLSSILWTVSLAVYLYFLLVHHGTSKARLFLMFAYFFCYGMPLLLTLWAMLTYKLGYSPYNSAGWCSVILVNPVYPHQRDIFMGIIGYDMWIYLALVLVSVLYFAIRAFLREELERTKNYVPKKQFWKAVNVLEYKFLSIPIAFFLLRMWTCIINLYVYSDNPGRIPQALVYLSGVGDSGQGFVNAVLFVLLTKQVRDSFLQLICCSRSCRCPVRNKPDHTPTTSENNSQPNEGAPLINSPQKMSCHIASRSMTSNSRSGVITPDPLTTSHEFMGSRNHVIS